MVVICESCGKKNRVSAANLAKQVNCGACKSPVTPIAHPIDADIETFEDVAQHSPLPALVDFWADWCGPCKMAAPFVARVASEMKGRAIVLKVDTEQYPEVAARHQVQSIPNFVVLRNGQVVRQQAGVVSAEEMMRWLE